VVSTILAAPGDDTASLCNNIRGGTNNAPHDTAAIPKRHPRMLFFPTTPLSGDSASVADTTDTEVSLKLDSQTRPLQMQNEMSKSVTLFAGHGIATAQVSSKNAAQTSPDGDSGSESQVARFT
jgi:hypothetical protein